jgi:hypothetical protein
VVSGTTRRAKLTAAKRLAVTMLAWAVLAMLVLFAPHTLVGLLTLLLGMLGALAVWAASQPILITFIAGAWAGWRVARRRKGWAT